jgi:hypothetical protein
VLCCFLQFHYTFVLLIPPSGEVSGAIILFKSQNNEPRKNPYSINPKNRLTGISAHALSITTGKAFRGHSCLKSNRQLNEMLHCCKSLGRRRHTPVKGSATAVNKRSSTIGICVRGMLSMEIPTRNMSLHHSSSNCDRYSGKPDE